ncbi:hypothetical protein J1605_004997 [Eschrichtius robustus]|uniref:Uncharacterized protein n=1 Tax=Eschrichtius robustus TaxID=9764 RepID=A0AB34HC34_ESCRO|nr:hypothetical protein J1605_004997 [Eschrichtius robustus]
MAAAGAEPPEEPATQPEQQAAGAGLELGWIGPVMDKLKKVLSGQDTEDRGGLSEPSASHPPQREGRAGAKPRNICEGEGRHSRSAAPSLQARERALGPS